MFSKALFKQSCKANGTMWCIITFAVCFMLACVMLISGNGNIGEVRNAIQDTIIVKEIDAQMEKRAISYYRCADEGLREFDGLFSDNVQDTLTCLIWFSKTPDQTKFQSMESYMSAVNKWQDMEPVVKTEAGKTYVESLKKWMEEMPSSEKFSDIQDYVSALNTWQENTPATEENAIVTAYTFACNELKEFVLQKAKEQGYEETSTEAQEMLGSVMYSLNPNGNFNDFYQNNGEEIPADYDVMTLIANMESVDSYLSKDERNEYRDERAKEGAAIFLAGNMTETKTVENLMSVLSDYGVTKEKYDSYGYNYDSIKYMAKTAIVTYQGRWDYELELLEKQNEDGKIKDEEAYQQAVETKKDSLASDIYASFLSTLPDEVSEALEEIGQADLYTLIVGSIFYKLAGLLLPIIYMIMASNNLISGQIDSGSMAYVLSTSTKRSTVVFTQAVYLIGSLFAMFTLTTATGCICLSLVTEEVELTYGNLILLNVGAFLVLLALSGLCFFTSCIFDRSKRSMAIGGGLSIFALVAAMLGLFGSPVIPSVVRLDALNYFNYATIISLFDVISIIDGTRVYIWKFIILFITGILGYVMGSVRFTRKDLPL